MSKALALTVLLLCLVCGSVVSISFMGNVPMAYADGGDGG
jgi:hypothetical protein